MNILNIFPIKNNRILFYSFNGNRYACNPKYISEYLYENDKDKDKDKYQIIWAFKNPSEYIQETGDKYILTRFRSLRYYYFAKTAKVIVYNVQEEGELSRRRGQVFIQTWHASNGYKKIGRYKNNAEKKKLELMHKNYTYVMSGCESMTERRIRLSMGFKGQVIPGTPRIDMLINQNTPEIRKKVYDSFNISEDTSILLYAPTWKKNRSDSEYGLDYDRLIAVLEKRFSGKWKILVKFHPNMKVSSEFENDNVLNATMYDDIQDLIYTADIMITDYSSCSWDFSFTGRPCFIFCNDFDETGGNDLFEVPIEEWGFPVCKSMDELTESISNFNADAYEKAIENSHRKFGSLEDGKAAVRVCSLIESVCYKRQDGKSNEKV